jgi:hypothetical protein
MAPSAGTAMPQESYPRYSSAFRAPRIEGAMSRAGPTYPKIPHIVFQSPAQSEYEDAAIPGTSINPDGGSSVESKGDAHRFAIVARSLGDFVEPSRPCLPEDHPPNLSIRSSPRQLAPPRCESWRYKIDCRELQRSAIARARSRCVCAKSSAPAMNVHFLQRSRVGYTLCRPSREVRARPTLPEVQLT